MKKEMPRQYKGLVTIAELPKGNPSSLDFAHYDLTPIDHDYSAQFQLKANHVFKSLGMNIGFLMMVGDPAEAPRIYQAFKDDPKYLGGGTGSGFKNRAVTILDKVDPLAKQIGAVNVVAKVNGELWGYNTDGLGFVYGLEAFLKAYFGSSHIMGGNFSKQRILLLGAGGTADAIAFTLAGCAAKITILNRSAEKAVALAEKINTMYGPIAKGGGEDLIASEAVKADIIINASKKGAEGPFKDYSALAPAVEGKLEENLAESAKVFAAVKPKTVVCDVNLRADESPTLRQARESGLPVQDGTAMNFYQAVEALWIIHHDDFVRLNVSKERLAELVAEVS